MNILQLGKYYPPVVGGIESHVRELCEGLVKSGNKVVCIVSSASNKSSSEIINGVKVVRLAKLVGINHPVNLSLPGYVKKLRNFDVVHLHMPNPSAEMSCLLAKPKKLIVSYHADVVGKFGAGIYLPFQKRVLRMADKIIVSSPQYADSSPVLEKFRHKCVVIPYGIDMRKFSDKRGMFLGKKPVFLFVGRLVRYKGVKYLIEAMKKVDGTLVVVGMGPLLSSLQLQVAKLNLNGRVKFFTDVKSKDLPDFYHSADVVVLPSISRAEAFGIVQLEAMACSKPIISTYGIVNRHLKTGLVVSPADSGKLASAMNKLSQNKQLCSKLGKNGKRLVQRHFEVSLMVDRIVDVYNLKSSTS